MLPQVVKLCQHGGVEWEPGSNRTATLPELPAALAAGGTAVIRVTCPFGDASGTFLQIMSTEELQAEVRVHG